MQNKDGNSLLSVGIDVGTTTTHMVLTRLKVDNQQVFNRLPNSSITRREILFKSPICFTPLKDGCIDGEAVARLIASFYRESGIEPQEVDTGAMIITGESARADNAALVIKEITRLAGDFVAEVAGPKLESALSARGSGAVAYAAATGKTILNADIGGGTTNVALIKGGEIIETTCLNLGGRLLRVEYDGTNYLLTGENQAASLIKKKVLADPESTSLTLEQLKKVSNLAAELIMDYLAGTAAPEYESLLQALSLTEQPSLHRRESIDEYWFSGGVASRFQNKAGDQAGSACPFGDIGDLLAQAIELKARQLNLPIKASQDAISATVIGAGMHSLQVSGCTINAETKDLPIKNIRLFKVRTKARPTDGNADHQWLAAQIEKQRSQLGLMTASSEPQADLAVYLQDLTPEKLGFEQLKQLALALSHFFSQEKNNRPCIVVTREDIAMSLSQILKPMLRDKIIITVDGIDAEEGDFMDLGKSVGNYSDPNCQSLTVVIKTLLFYK